MIKTLFSRAFWFSNAIHRNGNIDWTLCLFNLVCGLQTKFKLQSFLSSCITGCKSFAQINNGNTQIVIVTNGVLLIQREIKENYNRKSRKREEGRGDNTSKNEYIHGRIHETQAHDWEEWCQMGLRLQLSGNEIAGSKEGPECFSQP